MAKSAKPAEMITAVEAHRNINVMVREWIGAPPFNERQLAAVAELGAAQWAAEDALGDDPDPGELDRIEASYDAAIDEAIQREADEGYRAAMREYHFRKSNEGRTVA
jgi:hypothetical protein